MNSSRESSKANVCSLYVALFPGRFFFLPHFRNNRCNLKTFKTFCSSLPSICNDKKLCTSAQMCLYQIVCMTYLMWEPLENAHGHTDEIRAVEGGRGRFELLPSWNKCYILYLSQMLSRQCTSEWAVIWRESSARMLQGSQLREVTVGVS